MFRRFIAATMIGALALTTGCGLHNPFTSKAEPVTYESVVQSELSPEQKVDKLEQVKNRFLIQVKNPLLV